MDYMDIPESVVPDKQFVPLETAYRNYEANPDIENAYTFLGEASKIYDMPGVTQHTFDPIATMETAMEADFNARMRGMLDEAQTAGKSGMAAKELGVPETLTDADAAGMTMKMDGNGNGGYNGGDGSNGESEQPVYKPSPKHDPLSGWGSPDPIPDIKTGQEVLDTSYSSSINKQLYNYYDGKLVKFQPDSVNGWHSYEVINPAKEVPIDVLRQMLYDGKITKAQYKNFIKNK